MLGESPEQEKNRSLETPEESGPPPGREEEIFAELAERLTRREVEDMIDIDLEARTLNVRLTPEEICRRLSALPPFKSKSNSKWLRRYSYFVTSADQGAVLEEP